jgi:hypothetical protein
LDGPAQERVELDKKRPQLGFIAVPDSFTAVPDNGQGVVPPVPELDKPD